jgi:hypothetical protein
MLGKINAPFNSMEASLSTRSEAIISKIFSVAQSAMMPKSFGAESRRPRSI